MANFNIQIKKRNSTNDGWDNLYPATFAQNVVANDGQTVEAKLNKTPAYADKAGIANNVDWSNVSNKPSSMPAKGGTADIATVADYVANDSTNMKFHWSGKTGQPTWLWGGSDASDMYVYNPTNFNVNYANTAGSAPANGGTANYSNGLHRMDDGSNYAVKTNWTGTYWQLQGYNPDSNTVHAGCQVAYADTSGSVAWSNVSNKPTALSSFTNDSGYITSSGSCNYASSSGNADTVDGYHASSLMGGFDAGHSFEMNGYQKLSNGLIIQWGEENSLYDITNRTTATLNFPIAFPNAVLKVIPYMISSGSRGCTVYYQSSTLSSVTVNWDEWGSIGQAVKFGYMAIGY